MNQYKIVLLLAVFSFLSFSSFHKYYIGVTQVEYVKKQQSVQIISRVFIDDLEKALRFNYDEDITLDEDNETNSINRYLEQYINDNLLISVNKQPRIFQFIGKEYDGDIMRFYVEIPEVKTINSFKVSNTMLFEVCPTQQNIIKTKINAKQKSMILTIDNTSALLNFN
ncbi:DUF6702 family protein [Algibacter pacificus]|uniref:DUF6702 family protein n=1 Tax=Algibacter pacificus TaxID=2599389 RepID=UPI0011CC61AB|nr:DUF6702 family protein [Algibacter pacificus]